MVVNTKGSCYQHVTVCWSTSKAVPINIRPYIGQHQGQLPSTCDMMLVNTKGSCHQHATVCWSTWDRMMTNLRLESKKNTAIHPYNSINQLVINTGKIALLVRIYLSSFGSSVLSGANSLTLNTELKPAYTFSFSAAGRHSLNTMGISFFINASSLSRL